jgi:alpha-ketoglutarate-dependent taurine dioxygenase
MCWVDCSVKTTGSLELEMTIQSPPGLAVPTEALIDGSGYASLDEWISQNPDWTTTLYRTGFILFRGFGISEPAIFDATLDLLMIPSLEFSEETSPRSEVTSRSFTSTDYPNLYPIQFHHEFSYRRDYPERLAFCCIQPAGGGGATPLADSRKVLQRLPADIAERFDQLGITYIRNFSGFGVPWDKAFGTTDKTWISDYCDRHGIDHSWSGESLHTRQTSPATVIHPVTSERAWFNSVLNLNATGIEPQSVREAMTMLPPDMLPTDTAYGSGESIEHEVIEEVRRAYAAETMRFEWQMGDLLLIDNILTAHARDPFDGERRVVVGMGSAVASEI